MKIVMRVAVAAAAALLPVLLTVSPAAAEPSGTAFGDNCAAVTVVAVPGSNETNEASGMDVARGVLSDVVTAIGPYGPSIKVHYLGYPATIWDYDGSRAHGYQAAWSTIDYYAAQCPTTTFVLTGYSQGAHIAGDLAATIGKEGSPVSADRVRSVRLLADPVRSTGTPVVGTGGIWGGTLSSPFGGRWDFGPVQVTQYCNADDLVCNRSPSAVGDVLRTFTFDSHTSYQDTVVPTRGETYVQQMADDLVQDILNLNRATF